MYVEVQSIHFDADRKLVDFIKEKMAQEVAGLANANREEKRGKHASDPDGMK